MLDRLKNKKILILGLGREGLSTYKILRQLFPKNTFGLADQSSDRSLLNPLIPLPPSVHLHLGPDYLKSLDHYDVIIKSPGIPHFSAIKQAEKQGKITSQIKLFFENCPGKIIGITGTKGKGTTASLIYKILNSFFRSRSGILKTLLERKVYLAGNIGTPPLSLLERASKNDIFILELSSHQLADLQQSPHIAVFLNLFPEHLDYYKNVEAYQQAKANITKFQTPNDYLIYNADDRMVVRLTKNSLAHKISFSLTHKKADLYPDRDYLYFRRSPITPISLIPLLGRFNLKNIMAAVAVAKILQIPNQTINQAIKTFKPLPHRLELVGTFKGITFYNDSLATNPQATVEAIKALTKVGGTREVRASIAGVPAVGGNGGRRVTGPTEISTLITGGYDRGGISFAQVGRVIVFSGIRTVILFPSTGRKIWQAISARSDLDLEGSKLPKHFFVKNMETAVQLAYHHTPSGTLCLLSSASASFGIFKDYADRGNQFKKFIKKFSA